MTKLILSDDGVIQSRLIIEGDELITQDVMSSKNVESILDHNQRVTNDRMYNPQAHGRLAASIPAPLYYEWKKEWREKHRDKWTWKTFLVTRINNPDFKRLRTQESTVGLTSQDRK